MSDVEVTIGGNATPLKQAMAEVRASAGRLGEATGIEFGNRTAYMAEQRVSRGMDSVLRSLATAKNPIDAISGAVEGLSQSFRIAGSAFMGVAIGTFLKDQLETAAAGASDFYDKTADIFAVTKNSSKAFTDQAIKNFEDAKKMSDKRGWLMGFIFGPGFDSTLKAGTDALQDAMAHAREMREAAYKADADAMSADAETRMQGEIEKVNERYDAEVAKAQDAGDSIVDIERARAEAIEEIRDKAQVSYEQRLKQRVDLDREAAAEVTKQNNIGNDPAQHKSDLDDAQAKVAAAQKVIDNLPIDLNEGDAVKRSQAHLDLEKAITEEKKAQAEVDKDNQKPIDELMKSRKEGADLQTELDEAGMTRAQKIAALKKKIQDQWDQARKDEKMNPDFQDPVKRQEAENQWTKDKLELRRMEMEDASKSQEESAQRTSLLREQTAARSSLATAQADTMGWHGQVSSLRRDGFGHTPSGGNQNGPQLRALQESKAVLEKVYVEMAALNNKIGGAV